MSKGLKTALWVVSILLTALFVFAGLSKLLTPEKMLSQWVYARWFLTFIGVCETLGGIGLLIPRLAALAAAGLSCIMVGAIYTLVSHHLYKELPVPIVTLALLIGVVSMRRREGRVALAR
jgi:putative oxidoreductase